MDIMMMNIPSLLLLLISTIYKVWSLEEPRQEIYLEPRNFNPHPYNADSLRNSPDRGPILFPPSPPPETEGSNFIKIDNIRNSEHPVDHHPYSKLVKKHKYRNPGRHQEFENQINPRISEALAGHARKVLGHSKYDYPDILSSNEQKNYAFSYKVVDHLTGDDFSHTQSQDERATSGEYRVKLPDGRVQIVSYTADKNGYKADVKYQEEDTAPKEPQYRNKAQDEGGRIESYRNTQFNERVNEKYRYDLGGVQVTPTPSVPIHENHIEDYDYDPRHEKTVYAPSPTPTQLFFPVSQKTQKANHPTASSHQNRVQLSENLDYEDTLQTNYQQIPHRLQFIPHHKVQIINQGVPVLSSTVAPSYLENPTIILTTPTPQFSSDYQHVLVKSLQGSYGRK